MFTTTVSHSFLFNGTITSNQVSIVAGFLPACALSHFTQGTVDMILYVIVVGSITHITFHS